MKRLFSSPDLIQAAQLKDALEREGVPCLLRNDLLGGLAPEVPFTETFPEVWIQNDDDLTKAESIKSDWKRQAALPSTGPWVCPKCGERLEAQFSSCWSCGTEQNTVATIA